MQNFLDSLLLNTGLEKLVTVSADPPILVLITNTTLNSKIAFSLHFNIIIFSCMLIPNMLLSTSSLVDLHPPSFQ